MTPNPTVLAWIASLEHVAIAALGALTAILTAKIYATQRRTNGHGPAVDPPTIRQRNEDAGAPPAPKPPRVKGRRGE